MQATTNDLVLFLMQQPPEKEWLLEEHTEKKKKTSSQNRYYWNLLEEMAVVMKTPKMVLHNGYLRQLGQTKDATSIYERVAGKPMTVLIPDTEEAEKQTLLADTYHIAPTRRIKQGDDGLWYRVYVVIKGSSEFTVNQMAALIEFAVQDAKAVGIETLTPAELQHMKELELAHERKVGNNPRMG
jgi:hypothetical protein